MSSVLLESRPFRPFKSSEEYLYAMKEDLAEWLQTMYPHLNIAVENFMEKLETGVALCEHSNAVKAQAYEYVEKKRARNAMTRSVTGSLAQAQTLITIADVKYFSTAKPGTFFARDNVSNFINWCRFSLEIIECLLFESDDLIMRKNEKHVILCLLEVARRGAKFGMLAPMLVQMERQIDREIAADQKKMGVSFNEGNENQNGLDDDSDSDMEDEEPVMMYGPVPQIVTNDLKSLDEMVRDLVAKCTCPTQFPMIRVSEGKYRIGDTKVLIFVRILRNHVMVRVGGGWDTLSHYLDKHDPCRCRSQHRSTHGARLINKPGAADLHGSHVHYDRATAPIIPQSSTLAQSGPHSLGPPMNSLNRSRSRSPSQVSYADPRRSVSPNFPRKALGNHIHTTHGPQSLGSQSLGPHTLAPPSNRSRSPTPNFTSTHNVAKLSSSNRSPQHVRMSGPQSLPFIPTSPKSKHVSTMQIPVESKVMKTEAVLQVNDTDTHSDTTSEMSDEGYRSLGIVQDKSKKRSSVYSQNSAEDAEENEHLKVYTEDELNDVGLRKTQFSHRIYENDLSKSKKPSPSSSETSPTHSKPIRTLNSTPSIEKATSNVEKTISSPKKERSFTEEKVLRRANSVETGDVTQKSPKRSLANGTKKTPESKINTWNGRPKASRPSLTADTFTSPFQRNTSSRRSVSVTTDRRPSSTNTSPTKSKLRQELLQAVNSFDDDESIAVQVQELLKKYGSLSTLTDEADYQPKPFARNTERMSYRSPRKDSRADTNISRIPAPISYKA